MKKVIIFISWVLVTVVGYTLLLSILYSFLDSSLSGILVFVGSVAICLLLGLGQWLILLMKTRISGWFILVTSIALLVSVGISLVSLVFFLNTFALEGEVPTAIIPVVSFSFIIAGFIMGFCQWFFLYPKLHDAGWWILSNVLGWTGFAIGFFPWSWGESWLLEPLFVLVGVTIGIITGITLVLLPVRTVKTENTFQTPYVTDLDKYLYMLKSPNTSVRYDACEELSVATISNPEVILALEEATHDKDKGVAEAARKALGAEVHQHMGVKMGRYSTVSEMDSDVEQESEQPSPQNDGD